jgi:microcystin-dependent protein
VPEAPNDGQQYARKSLGWSIVAGGSGGGSNRYTASTTPPTSPTPVPGDFWYNLTTGALAIYVDDGNSLQWVQVSPVPAPAVSPPTGFTTGDAKITLKVIADSGWVMMNDGTIGSATSGSSTRANADCQDLFNLLFANISDTSAPLLTSSGAATTRATQGTAAAAWAANCRMTLTKQLGRSIAVAGSGAGLTARGLGATYGTETVTITLGNMPSHAHGISDPNHAHAVYDPGHAHIFNPSGWDHSDNGGDQFPVPYMHGEQAWTDTRTTGISIYGAATGVTTVAAGSGTPVDTMSPSTYWNVMIKL